MLNARTLGLLSVLAAGFAAGCEAPVPVHHGLLNKPRFTRCVMKPNGQEVYSSNFIDDRAGTGFKPGADVVVEQFAEIKVDLKINKIPYSMKPLDGRFDATNIEGFFKRYFVDSKDELGLDKMEPAIRKRVEGGVAAIGMSKEEVYTALGPPPQVMHGQNTIRMAREEIMESNRWIYFTSAVTPFWFQRVYVFDENKLTQVIQ